MRRASSASFAWISASVTRTSVRSASISRASIPVCSLLSYGERMPRAYPPRNAASRHSDGGEGDAPVRTRGPQPGQVDRALAVPVGDEPGELEGLRARERDAELG